MTLALQLTGERFGRLMVVERLPSNTSGSLWRCICDCGAPSFVRGCNLKSGKTKSCGCLNKELIRAQGFKNRRHGMSHTPEHRSWAAMMTRCFDTGSKDYPRWGGQGITVCERWRTFENFYADMGDRPNGTSIDRWPNQSGGYEPGNCRWATPKEQTRNRSVARILSHEGKEACVSEWSELTGIADGTILARLTRGWTVSDALTRKVLR